MPRRLLLWLQMFFLSQPCSAGLGISTLIYATASIGAVFCRLFFAQTAPVTQAGDIICVYPCPSVVPKAFFAASMVLWISASVCAVDTKAASNCEGGR